MYYLRAASVAPWEICSPRGRDPHRRVPIEPQEPRELPFKDAFLIAVRGETERPVLDVRGGSDALALHAFGAQVRFDVFEQLPRDVQHLWAGLQGAAVGNEARL